MSRQINKNFRHLVKSFLAGKRGSVLEGSSRSGKTWSSIDFLVYLCVRVEQEGGATINIIRETYASFKTTLYDDFARRLRDYGIESKFGSNQEISQFRINNNKINLIGADKPSKYMGASSDYFFINEAVYVGKQIFDQLEMRCRKFWWMDYNPSFEKHYIYNSVIPRHDVSYLKTTYLDNPFISKEEKNKILSYDPSNKHNVECGTADEYMWKVYGLGERARPKGLIFPYWREYETLPENCEFNEIFALDFGGSDPNALIQVFISRKYRLMYVKEHLYQSEVTTNDLIKRVRMANPNNLDTICDSARSDKILDLQVAGIFAIGIKKTTIEMGIDIMKQYSIYVHKYSENTKTEFDNYKWVEDIRTGESTNKPIDDYNHAIDAIRYAATYYHYNYL